MAGTLRRARRFNLRPISSDLLWLLRPLVHELQRPVFFVPKLDGRERLLRLLRVFGLFGRSENHEPIETTPLVLLG